MILKNITDALKEKRPDDMVVEILSNKFAVVKVANTDGTFDKDGWVCGLDNGAIYFYDKVDTIQKYYINIVAPERIVNNKNRRGHIKYKRNYRNILRLLNLSF